VDEQVDNRTADAAELFGAAELAASQGRPDLMIEALARSGFLDGLVRGLESRWRNKLPRSEIEHCVAAAVDSAYATIRAGGSIRELGAWLWKVSDNVANDSWAQDHRLRETMADDIAEPAPAMSDEERDTQDRLAEHRRAEAVRWARRLLPRIGQGQVLAVMELVVDAVEKSIPDFAPGVIADSLGIGVDAARTLLSRGFARLKREARREGIEFPEDLAEADEPVLTDSDDDAIDELEG
jgi:DNA-directed RNA polymerase specialized sigma24 family protein